MFNREKIEALNKTITKLKEENEELVGKLKFSRSITNEQIEEVSRQKIVIDELNVALVESDARSIELSGILEDKSEMMEELKLSLSEYEKSDHISDSNHIYFIISDDLQTVTPIIRYKEGVEEKLIEQRILNDANVSSYAIQIGLALVVKDALDLMVESATEGMDEDED